MVLLWEILFQIYFFQRAYINNADIWHKPRKWVHIWKLLWGRDGRWLCSILDISTSDRKASKIENLNLQSLIFIYWRYLKSPMLWNYMTKLESVYLSVVRNGDEVEPSSVAFWKMMLSYLFHILSLLEVKPIDRTIMLSTGSKVNVLV